MRSDAQWVMNESVMQRAKNQLFLGCMLKQTKHAEEAQAARSEHTENMTGSNLKQDCAIELP